MALFGIDVSEHNGSVDWDRVATDAEFCFIKATEGRTYKDARLTGARVEQAENALGGAFVGYYHFARPDNNKAREEARHFVAQVRAVGGRVGRNAVLDYEVLRPGGGDEEWITTWVDEFKQLTDRRPIIYGGAVLREKTSSNFGCPLWLAAYVPDPDPWVPKAWRHDSGPRLRVWQFTESARCAGVSGEVDGNRFFGDKDELRSFMTYEGG